MTHVVLLGDSIFDNAMYVPGGPPVIEQLRSNLPDHWAATLLAVDGHVTKDVHWQLDRLPSDASHLVVSCGGNDALQCLPVMTERVANVAQALNRFAAIRAEFQSTYREMLKALIQTGHCVTVCTVYDCVPGLEANEQSALAMFNEIILREAIGAGVGLIDLRHVCSEAADYSEISPIEPSEQGGQKIAATISKLLVSGPSATPSVGVYK